MRLEAPARLLPLLSHPELWNWTPVVSTMQNMSGGAQQAQHALVRADAMTVFLDVLSFGRPTLQVTAFCSMQALLSPTPNFVLTHVLLLHGTSGCSAPCEPIIRQPSEG